MATIAAEDSTRKGGLRQRAPGTQVSVKRKKLQCPNCPYETDCHCNLKVHIPRIHTAEKPFECSFCSYNCTTNEGLQNHCRIHTGEKPFKCSQFQRDFARRQGLKAHVLTAHSKVKAGPFCGEVNGWKSTFKCRSRLQSHNQTVPKEGSTEKRLPCGLCPKTLKTNTSLQIHLRAHTREKPFKCSECDFATSQQVTLNNHVKTKHSEVYDFPCNFPGCEAKFKLKYCWKLHVDIFHKKITRFCCPDCPKEFFKGYLMKIHYRRCHSKEKPYECDLCEFRAVTSSELGSHKRHIHTEYLNVKCTDCDKSFKNTEIMKQHWKRKHTGKPRVTSQFHCPEPDCGKEYQTKNGLKYHIRSWHTTSAQQFSCLFCSYASTELSSLTAHLRCHTGEAPYKCKDCGKCFKQSSGLRTHKHVHSEEKRFKCKLCAYQGKTKQCLEIHEQTQHPNPPKPFSCTTCPYKCTTKRFLQRHLATHLEEKPFHCQQCSFRAKLKHALRKHGKSRSSYTLYML